MTPAPFGFRLCAAALDALFLLLGVVIIGLIFTGLGVEVGGAVMGSMGSGGFIGNVSTAASTFRVLEGLETILITAFIFGTFSAELFFAKSLGKMIMQLRICSSDGSSARRAQLTKRFLAKFGGFLLVMLLSLLSLVTGGIGDLSILVRAWFWILLAGFSFALRPSRQALYDSFAGTNVFRREAASPAT